VMTFAEMKQQMEEAASRAQSRSKDKDATKKDDVQAQFKVTAKATGQTKTVQGLNAKEMQINMAMEGTDKTTGQTGAMNITTDAWYAPVPGYDEVKAFHQRMAAKLGYIFGSGMQQIAQMGAAQGGQNMSINMEDVAREMAKIDGVPVESTVVMGGSGTPAAAGSSTPAAAPPPQKERESVGAAAAGAAIGRIPGLGGFGRKRKDDTQDVPPPAAQKNSDQSAASGSLMEMTTTLNSFSPGTVDGAQFEVPAGFKQVEGGRRGR